MINSDLDIIASKLISEELDEFRYLFRSMYRSLSIFKPQDTSKQVVLLIEAASDSKT
jgi:hypothetical protein